MGFYGNNLQMHLCAAKAKAEGENLLSVLSATAGRKKSSFLLLPTVVIGKLGFHVAAKEELMRHDKKLPSDKGSKCLEDMRETPPTSQDKSITLLLGGMLAKSVLIRTWVCVGAFAPRTVSVPLVCLSTLDLPVLGKGRAT